MTSILTPLLLLQLLRLFRLPLFSIVVRVMVMDEVVNDWGFRIRGLRVFLIFDVKKEKKL